MQNYISLYCFSGLASDAYHDAEEGAAVEAQQDAASSSDDDGDDEDDDVEEDLDVEGVEEEELPRIYRVNSGELGLRVQEMLGDVRLLQQNHMPAVASLLNQSLYPALNNLG